MTFKRMKKLLMARGYSRNYLNRLHKAMKKEAERGNTIVIEYQYLKEKSPTVSGKEMGIALNNLFQSMKDKSVFEGKQP